MTEIRYVLRKLPGVADMEARIARIKAHPNPNWAPEKDGLEEDFARLSRRLFGIDIASTFFDAEQAVGDFDEAYDAWYAHFDAVDHGDDATTIQAFHDLGWDVTTEDGALLGVAWPLSRQIICVAKGLAGHLPGNLSEAEARVEAEDWGASLAAEASKFRPKR